MRLVLRSLLLASCLVAGAAPAFGAGGAASSESLLAQYSATDRFRGGQPRAFVVTPDGAEVLFLRAATARTRVNDLWALDTRTGRERVILTADQVLAGAEEKLTKEEWARRQRLRMSARGITGFQLSADGRRMLVPLSGRLFVVERASGAVRELSPDKRGANDARFSPDGAMVALVRGGDLCVIDIASGVERTLVAHEGDRVTWGLPEFIAQEEMRRYEGWWWSPDSRFIAAQRTDESQVERMRIADPADPAAEPVEFAYPRPGRNNADVKLAVIPVAGGAPRFVQWDRARFPYLCTVRWSKGGPLALVVMTREQQDLALLACDAATGETRTLLAEHDDVWINLAQSAPRFLPDGRFLWIAEGDDTGPQLELRGSGGALLCRLSPPNVRVTAIAAVTAAGDVYANATTDAFEDQVWRMSLDGKRPAARVSAEPGSDGITLGEGTTVRLRSLRPVTGPLRWVVEDARGKRLCEVKSNEEKLPFEPRVEWTRVTADSLRAFIVRPRDFDPRKRYPVVDWAYGGPHSNQVVHRAGRYVLEQYLADQGFIVVSVDGRGTPGRGRTFERSIRGDLIGPALADHVAGIRDLCARHPEMDGDRVGVTGWSFGGYFAAIAVERQWGFYKAAVAGAPVVDWRDYDTFYTERYLGLPAADSAAYARSSALTDAAQLRMPLLVIHGTADDNVYFFNTLRLADALNRAGRDWDFLPLPGQTHSVIAPEQVQRVYSRMAGYFREHLGSPGDAAPPEE